MIFLNLMYFQATPVKTEQQILENSMSEDDPNANSISKIKQKAIAARWGPNHKVTTL